MNNARRYIGTMLLAVAMIAPQGCAREDTSHSTERVRAERVERSSMPTDGRVYRVYQFAGDASKSERTVRKAASGLLHDLVQGGTSRSSPDAGPLQMPVRTEYVHESSDCDSWFSRLCATEVMMSGSPRGFVDLERHLSARDLIDVRDVTAAEVTFQIRSPVKYSLCGMWESDFLCTKDDRSVRNMVTWVSEYEAALREFPGARVSVIRDYTIIDREYGTASVTAAGDIAAVLDLVSAVERGLGGATVLSREIQFR